MKELTCNEVEEVSGGVLPLIIYGGAALAGALTGGYAVGQIVGEAAQRDYEANQTATCSITDSIN